jgi:hypothetical protein
MGQIMKTDDVQILRLASLELQVYRGDLVRVAGIAQKIKDWWYSKKNRQALQDAKLPIDQVFSDLDTAIKGHDANAVDKIISTELPSVIRSGLKDIVEIRNTMLTHTTEHVGKGGETLSGGNLGWVTKDYQKDKSLVEKLWEMLPEEFRNEIPVGKRINQPISNFSWYKRYSPENIVFSTAVKDNIWKGLSRLFDPKVIEYLKPGFEQFLQNLQNAILNNSILVTVNFSPVSTQVAKRYSNEMRMEVHPSEVAFPAGDSEVLINIDKVILTDLGTRIPAKNQLSVLGVWVSNSGNSRTFTIPEISTASDGPITKIVKRALLKNLLPITTSTIKVTGQTFEHKVQFAKVLASALRQEIDAECSIRHKNQDVEIQANVCGSKVIVLSAIFGISKCIANEFFQHTKTGIDIDVRYGISDLDIISSEIMDNTFRKVALASWRIK